MVRREIVLQVNGYMGYRRRDSSSECKGKIMVLVISERDAHVSDIKSSLQIR